MSAQDSEQNLQAMCERLGPAPRAALEPGEAEVGFAGDVPMAHLVRAMLAWEAGEELARRGVSRVLEGFVDANELRVCPPDEVASLLGVRYPRGQERCERLHFVLNAIFRRENATSLGHLMEWPKREARQYLEELEGMPRYAACRVTLLGLGGHAVPVDERLRRVLGEAGVIGEIADADELSNWLERRIRAGDAAPFFAALEALADGGGVEAGAASQDRTDEQP